MRFADKGYYIEAYRKCANCGVLVYDDGLQAQDSAGAMQLYCSDWCRQWAALRDSGAERRRLPFTSSRSGVIDAEE